MSSISARLHDIQEIIQGKAPQRNITLVAVTKYATVAQMTEAYAAGVRHFGENKVQDALLKMAAFPAEQYPDLQWHYIGNLQLNKVKKTTSRFAIIHTVDDLRQAESLSRQAQLANQVQDVLMQVNLTGDSNRHGVLPEQALAMSEALFGLPGLALRGLMTIAPAQASLNHDETMLRTVFCGLRELRDQLEGPLGIDLPDLSMGMTHDFPHALECGATILRIGSYLFKK